ncbi:MAG: di-trans,poly-cis-decaprenylcistransferase [Ruminococcaceae bacterium]|nr:di-trans,poly-cis-decaprenylcistransferase [Oscillospiraceae bacterium]
MKIFKKTDGESNVINGLPRHIAIILDGNGRWAQKKGMPRTAGHSYGAENFRTISKYCKEIGIKYLTVYAFSTENWKRPKAEVDAIMNLLEKYLLEAIEKMENDRIKLKFLGDMSVLSPKLQKMISEVEEISSRYDGVQANICLNYGSRDEIVKAAIRYAEDYKATGKALNEEEFSRYLYSCDIPDPDLVIRPSGEYRLSNFLMWQSAYSELYFTEVLWPDFTPEELDKALESYSHRKRLYGGLRK